ncbi:DUF2934 domain-containing protein [Chenggangzhangella methanolivorans]|uniref:DUF2934 domain-containing protein n=1 Tax=Chenggangzhangella methanolivorans TaxID=1437009 RepID=A0A9E6RC18_9HYPH|nr:DUF2934 domain-containing protein [Chenggangzhangella methanolivorans]QZO01095.1 DUF2934 domain-containing protein [Chenggangzhangella methanolivorans]
MSDREAQIKQRAYELWVQAGQPEGNSEQFWYQAERDISGDDPAAANKGGSMEANEKLDQELEESVPASDPPSATQP